MQGPYEVKSHLLPFAIEVKRYRKRATLTSAELADKLDISLVTLSRIENGRTMPRAETLQKMAHLGIDIKKAFLTEKPTPITEGLTVHERLSQLEENYKELEGRIDAIIKILSPSSNSSTNRSGSKD